LSYSGIHKPSLLGRLLGLVGTAVAAIGIWWLVFTGFQDVRTTTGIVWLMVGVTVSLVIAICLHEAGHLLAGLGLGQPVRKIRIGSGDTLLGFRVRGIVVQICANPLGGGAVYFSGLDSSHVDIRMASLVAGPAVNLLAAAYAFGLVHSGVTWLGAFALANTVVLIGSVVPATSVEHGHEQVSDGMQVLRLLFKPSARSAYFEGAEMAGEAKAALVGALEEAELVGAPEVSDLHLLRALSRDPALGALFATLDLDSRLPPGEPPQSSDDTQTPTWSASAHKVIDSAFRQARDMGSEKPNAAGICLGLLAVDCPAGRLLKDAGISLEEVRRLAAGSTDAQDSVRPGKVISPDLPLERWGTAADRVLAFAYRIAAADHSGTVGTQHIVAALVADPQSRGARALARLGFVLVRHDRAPSPSADQDGDPAPQLSPQAAAAIAGSLERTGARPSSTAELCLGILDQNAGIGAQILTAAGVTVAAMERALRLEARDSTEAAGCTPASWPMWQIRSSARMGAGRWVDARDDLLLAARVATTDEHRAMCQNNAAWASLMSGQPTLRAEALELARAAKASQPDRLAFIGTYAFALLENGSPAEAAALLEPVASTHPRPRDRASDLCLLAMCFARLQRHDAAATNLRAAREADPRCALLERAQAEVDKATATTVS
jgi:hypothetical protein